MKMKSLALMSAIAITLSPFAAHAVDLSVTNNTKTAASASLDNTGCSGVIPMGVIKPGQTTNVKGWVLNRFCNPTCTAHIYMDKNCHSKVVATATVSASQGIVKVENHNVDGYHVEFTATHASLEGGPSRKWYQWFL
ncbi:MAG TPA: hypothetical protein VL360_04160 [Gammaproteobacteria bacterium]|nr:hypothetical protein [Gammaproteobacteria bacterium]